MSTGPCTFAELSAKLVGFVASEFEIREGDLKQRNREKLLADARAAICYLAVRELGYNGEKVAGILNISRSGASVAARRGEAVVRARKSLLNLSGTWSTTQQRPCRSVRRQGGCLQS
ncbi:MAG: hypothetical protein M1497_03075 [Nitrospirae bacterium]|nr:hypothetical protein [Nitrospirota bacterium]